MARKEINLSPKTIKRLQKLADADKRKLKPYMEKILENHSTNPIDPSYGVDVKKPKGL